MTVVNASSMVSITKLFPTVKHVASKDEVDTSPITALEAAAEDSASAGLNIAQMIASNTITGSGATSPADAIFGVAGGLSLNV